MTSTTLDAPTSPHNRLLSHNSIRTHIHAKTCDKFDFEDSLEGFENISCLEYVGNGGEYGDAYMCKDQLCEIEGRVSGGRPGEVKGTRSPGGELGGKGDEYKDNMQERNGWLRQNGGMED